MHQVPFNDLHAQYLSIKEEVDAAISEVIRTSGFIRGHFVEKFESEFAGAHGLNHCVSCANGTDSLYIAMHALGMRQGDEVIVPAHSWISTSETVTQAGGKPVFVDTESNTYTIDVTKIEEKVTSKTVGIIPVHLYGQAANMNEVIRIAKKHNLWVIEDCAQAHLAKYQGKLVGTFGNAASFSFYPGKNLGAMGDAGAIITDDTALAEKMAMYARHGGLKKGDHQIEGINSRLDGIQAAILSVKLLYLKDWTKARQKIAQWYNAMLSTNIDITIPKTEIDREHVWHLYVIKHEKRDELSLYLKRNGIQTSINYPIALPYLPAYGRFEYTPNDFPNAFHNQSRILSLPIYPELALESLEIINQEIMNFAN